MGHLKEIYLNITDNIYLFGDKNVAEFKLRFKRLKVYFVRKLSILKNLKTHATAKELKIVK